MKNSKVETKQEKLVKKENLIIKLKKQAYGPYLDRLERAAEVLNRNDVVNVILSVRQVYNFCQCQPEGMTKVGGILWIISLELIKECESRGFSKNDLNHLYYVVYSSLELGLKPVP